MLLLRWVMHFMPTCICVYRVLYTQYRTGAHDPDRQLCCPRRCPQGRFNQSLVQS